MLLQKLREHAGRLDLAPPMYQRMEVHWLLDLDGDGRCLGPLVATEGGRGTKARGKVYLTPHKERTVGVAAKLLADNGEYVLGVARDPHKQEKVNQRHRAFVEAIRHCADATSHPAVVAVARFLEGYTPGSLELPENFKASHNLTFRVDGELPIELPEVRTYWAGATGEGVGAEECLICGQSGPILENVPFKIKGIPGGQTSGMALVSTNAPAFVSYGLECISSAPVCPECGEQFSKAIDALIRGESTHITLGPLVYLFWTRDDSWSPCSILENAEPSEVRELLASVFGGNASAVSTDPKPFYATALSASGGRVVVRDWLETTVPKAKRNLARYFALQKLVGEWGEDPGTTSAPYLPVRGYWAGDSPRRWRDGLAESVVPPRNGRREPEKLPASVPQTLLRLALHGGELPTSLLWQAVLRNRAEQGISRPRAALIKMVLLSQRTCPETTVSENELARLEPENRDPAYLCGRLLAVLEALQQKAVPGAKATVTDRFFGTASSAPAAVFGRLLRGAQAHLGKLRKEKPRTHEAMQQKLEEIQKHLAGYPRLLTLEQQGLFSLGYYHQRADDRAAARTAREARDQSS